MGKASDFLGAVGGPQPSLGHVAQPRQTKVNARSRGDPGWVFPSPRACPTFSPSPVLKAPVSKCAVAAVLVAGFPHLFLHSEKIPGRVYAWKELEGVRPNGW